MNSLILRAGTRILVALLLILSLFMLWRGHNAPGGGFIGGLLAAAGFAVYAISSGTADARRALRVRPETVAVAGLGIAILGALAAAFDRDPFFTGQWLFLGADPAIPGDKGLPLSTVLVFDIGVYLVVFGSVLALVFALEEEV